MNKSRKSRFFALQDLILYVRLFHTTELCIVYEATRPHHLFYHICVRITVSYYYWKVFLDGCLLLLEAFGIEMKTISLFDCGVRLSMQRRRPLLLPLLLPYPATYHTP
jgi:hypothetical protein